MQNQPGLKMAMGAAELLPFDLWIIDDWEHGYQSSGKIMKVRALGIKEHALMVLMERRDGPRMENIPFENCFVSKERAERIKDERKQGSG